MDFLRCRSGATGNPEWEEETYPLFTDEGSYDFCRAFLCQRRPHLDGRARQHGGRM